MMWGIIATWTMAYDGIKEAGEILQAAGNAKDALEKAIIDVENGPYYKSVGYGGLPNKEMIVELDAAFMDGDTFDVGAVGAIQDFANPISIARALSTKKVNNILVGEGAAKYAAQHGFERKTMLTERAKIHYDNKIEQLKTEDIKPYDGHDTVGMVCLDQGNSMAAGTSTSGLFMKEPGRVGDSPICGSGFYVDSKVGGATATGLGEDLMKGCISYEIVSLMKRGMSPQEAVDKAVGDLNRELISRRSQAGDISVVAMNNQGQWGVATNIEGFSFAVATADQPATVYVCENHEDGTTYAEATEAWLNNYYTTRKAPLKRLK